MRLNFLLGMNKAPQSPALVQAATGPALRSTLHTQSEIDRDRTIASFQRLSSLQRYLRFGDMIPNPARCGSGIMPLNKVTLTEYRDLKCISRGTREKQGNPFHVPLFTRRVSGCIPKRRHNSRRLAPSRRARRTNSRLSSIFDTSRHGTDGLLRANSAQA